MGLLGNPKGRFIQEMETEDWENFHLHLLYPKTHVKEVLEEIHKSGGHLGVNKTMEKVRKILLVTL